jgi:acyl-CoA thioester hydrolase
MESFSFTHPIDIRYGDLDPQWHVNNSRYLTFFEQGRFAYLMHLGLWDGKSFFDLKSIVADAHVSFLAPIKMNQKITVRVRVERIGNKSLTFVYSIEDVQTGQVLARGETVIVTYDYNANASIRVPDEWREKISAFEKKDFSE